MEATRRETIRCGWALYALLGLLLSCTVSRSSALSVHVVNEECVYEYVIYDGDTVSGNFVVDDETYWSSNHHTNIDFTVTSPRGNVVHSLKESSGEKFEFKASEQGLYKFCFHNPHSVPQSVAFSIHAGHIPNNHDLAKDEHLDPINVKIAELREKLEYVTILQNYLKGRETRHRHTNQNTSKRVIFFTIGEYLLLTLVSGLQVTFIRRLFSKSFAIGRV